MFSYCNMFYFKCNHFGLSNFGPVDSITDKFHITKMVMFVFEHFRILFLVSQWSLHYKWRIIMNFTFKCHQPFYLFIYQCTTWFIISYAGNLNIFDLCLPSNFFKKIGTCNVEHCRATMNFFCHAMPPQSF